MIFDRKHNGHNTNIKLGMNQLGLYSLKSIQYPIAIHPAAIVSVSDISANGFQMGLPRRDAATAARPEHENATSSGKNDQFHATTRG